MWLIFVHHGGLDRLPACSSARSPRRWRCRSSSPRSGSSCAAPAMRCARQPSTSRESRMVDGVFAVGSHPHAVRARDHGRGDRRRARAGGQRRRGPLLELDGVVPDPHRRAGGRLLAPTWPPSTSPPTPPATATPSSRRPTGCGRWAPGLAAGALAIVGLIVLHADAHSLYTALLHGAALAVLIVSLLAGAAALALVRHAALRAGPLRRRAGRGRGRRRLGIRPLPGAAARADRRPGRRAARHAGGGRHRRAGRRRHPVPVAGPAVRAAAAAGAWASLAETGAAEADGGVAASARGRSPRSTPLQTRVAVALLIAGVGFLNAADAGWAHLIGVFALFGFIVIGFAAIVPRALAEDT